MIIITITMPHNLLSLLLLLFKGFVKVLEEVITFFIIIQWNMTMLTSEI
jgi:hypothetical protein